MSRLKCVAPISEQNGSVGEVLKQADVACCAAKDAGRNRVQVFLQHDDNGSGSKLWFCLCL